LVWHLVHFPSKVFEEQLSGPNVKTKVLVRVGMGFDSVDLKAAGDRGIYVVNVPDYGVEEVADSTLSLILNLMRKTHVLANRAKENNWPTHAAKGATRIRGKMLGIIGLGKIGRAVAERAKPFGFDVYFYDPYLPDGVDKSMGIKRFDKLEELIAVCDVVSLNCDLNQDNHHLLNETTLAHIPANKGLYLVNTARGGLIEEAALLRALSDGRIAAAGLDVLEHEPYFDGHLNNVPNLLVTPHAAFYSDEGFIEMRTKAALEIKRVLEGSAPRNCVNKLWMRFH